MATEPAIGTSIKRARERLRWTQRQLADALGVNIKTIDNWENSRTHPRSSIGALEDVLGVDLTAAPQAEPELVGEDDWERSVIADPDLPDRIKRQLISDSRASRARYAARRSERLAAEQRELTRQARRPAS